MTDLAAASQRNAACIEEVSDSTHIQLKQLDELLGLAAALNDVAQKMEGFVN